MLLATDGRHEGVALRLYGPDASGVLDSSAPVQSGHGAARWACTAPQRLHELRAHRSPHQRGLRWAGHHRARHHSAAHHRARRPLRLLGGPQELLAGAYGGQAIDDVGNTSGSPTSGSALVIGRPARLSSASVAVSGGVVTATVELETT